MRTILIFETSECINAETTCRRNMLAFKSKNNVQLTKRFFSFKIKIIHNSQDNNGASDLTADSEHFLVFQISPLQYGMTSISYKADYVGHEAQIRQSKY